MRPRFRNLVLALAAGFAATSCDSSLFGDNCEVDRIVAHFDGTLMVRGSPIEIQRDDPLAPTNLSPEDFLFVNGVLLEGASSGGVVWSHGGIRTANDFFAIALGAPVRDGQIRPVSSVFQGGGWGPFAMGANGAAFALRLDDVWATGVVGAVTVVEAVPLKLDVALDITLSDGATGRLTGTDTFRYDRGTCTDARR